MKVGLLAFQVHAVKELRAMLNAAQEFYKNCKRQQAITFAAPTGAGKTIMLATLVEDVYNGSDGYPEQNDAIFVWLSDSPELNKQSMDKFYFNADRINHAQLEMIDESNFDKRVLDDGKIYFLNTQKLSKTSRLTQLADNRQYTIWQTLQSTIEEKAEKLYFIIDEAHRGAKGKEAGRATTIMQKFIKGSEEDSLSPMPLVIGMTATPERFENLLASSPASKHNVEVPKEEVQASGLLKERIIVTYPEEERKGTAVAKDMSVLAAAAEEWKSKCEHWQRYLSEQGEKIFNPIFVIQVENVAGNEITATNLDECLKIISERTGKNFEVGEVVHTFGQSQADLTMNNLRVPYAEPSSISGNDKIQVVFFKENLSTGWDCPQAETMMSFRSAADSTYIAQLLGRMIRTPLQRRIELDDTLNEVRLFLPHFDRNTVDEILDAFKKAKDGVPVEIIGESLGDRKIVTLTVNDVPPITAHKAPKKISTPTSASGHSYGNDKPRENLNAVPATSTVNVIDDAEKKSTVKPPDEEFILKPVTEDFKPVTEEPAQIEETFNRKEIVKAINAMALTTYRLNYRRTNDYLKSLLKLAHFIMQSGLWIDAFESTVDDIVNFIREYIEKLKSSGEYEKLNEEVKKFKLEETVFNSAGNVINQAVRLNLFMTAYTDIDRQFVQAESRLQNEGIAQAYLNKFAKTDGTINCKIDVIIFVHNANCLEKLESLAKDKFHKLVDEYRKETVKLTDEARNKYNQIVEDADIVGELIFHLPETMTFTQDADGKIYEDHLFIDKNTGTAKIKLNGWEEKVLEEERQREDFVCWIRNSARKNFSLGIAYKDERNEDKLFYPDFLIVRRVKGEYIIDILEPHDPNRRDNIGKARSLAAYAEKNSQIGRVELIREKEVAGQKIFKRLNMARSAVRDEVKGASSNSELDKIFERLAKGDN